MDPIYIMKEATLARKYGLDADLIYIPVSSLAIQAALGKTRPQVKNSRPADFIDPSILKGIESSGFVKSLYGK
jgi:hypothetical protein